MSIKESKAFNLVLGFASHGTIYRTLDEIEKAGGESHSESGIDLEYGCPSIIVDSITSLPTEDLPLMLFAMFTPKVSRWYKASGGNVATLDLARLILAEECISRELLTPQDLIGKNADWTAHRARIIRAAGGTLQPLPTTTIH